MYDTAIAQLDASIRQLDTRVRDIARLEHKPFEAWIRVVAHGDGVSDDTDAVEKSLESIDAQAIARGVNLTAYFGPGIYLTDHLVIPPHVSLKGSGRDVTILRNRETNGGNYIHHHGSFATISDMTIDGQRAAQPVTGSVGLASLLFSKHNGFTAGPENVAGGLTLSAGPSAGATSITVTTLGANTVLPGEIITLLEGSTYEIVRVSNSYAGGTTIQLSYPLLNAFTTAAKVSVASTGNTLHNCVILGAGRQCVTYWHAFESLAHGCWFRDASDSCVDAESGGRDLLIEKCHFEINGRWGTTMDTQESWCGMQAECSIVDCTARFVNGSTDPDGELFDAFWLGTVERVTVRGGLVDMRRGGISGATLHQLSRHCRIDGLQVVGRGPSVANTFGIRHAPSAGGQDCKATISDCLLQDLNRAVDLDNALSGTVNDCNIYNVNVGINTEPEGTSPQHIAYTGNMVDGSVIAFRFGGTPAAGSRGRLRGNVSVNNSFIEIDPGTGWAVYRDEGPKRWFSTSAGLNFPNVVPGTPQELTVSITAVDGDDVSATPVSGIEAGLSWDAFVSAPDTVTIRLHNLTAAAIDPAVRNWTVTVTRP